MLKAICVFYRIIPSLTSQLPNSQEVTSVLCKVSRTVVSCQLHIRMWQYGIYTRSNYCTHISTNMIWPFSKKLLGISYTHCVTFVLSLPFLCWIDKFAKNNQSVYLLYPEKQMFSRNRNVECKAERGSWNLIKLRLLYSYQIL